MGFESVLQVIGKDAKGVFHWLASSQGQTVVGAVETGIEVAFPVATGVIALFNKWMAEALKVETLATAAGQQNGSGTIKAAAVLSTVTPEVLAFCQQAGLNTPTAATLETINTNVIAILNALGKA
jgi:hypothetical protein